LDQEGGFLPRQCGQELARASGDPRIPRGHGVVVHVVIIGWSEPDEVHARVELRENGVRIAGDQVRAPRRVPGDRRIRKEREVILASWRRVSASGSTRDFRDGLPGLTGDLSELAGRGAVNVL